MGVQTVTEVKVRATLIGEVNPDKKVQRHVMCQSQVTYTSLRGATTPRFLPLPEHAHG